MLSAHPCLLLERLGRRDPAQPERVDAGWATPFGFCLHGLRWLSCLRVVFPGAYPTTYLANLFLYAPPRAAIVARPARVPRTVPYATVAMGMVMVQPQQGLNPTPADLTAAHVDDHTEGDLFWWLTHGIAGTAMPPWQEQFIRA